jgi:hypothetical protein
VVNSRFAAAAEADRSYNSRPDDRDSNHRFSNNDRPALPQNSRFAAAAAMDEDYVDREERQRRFQEDRGGGDERGGRHSQGRGGDFRGGDDYNNNYRGGGHNRGTNPYEEPPPEKPSRVDELLLRPKKAAADENILVPPSKEHEDNMFKIPAKMLNKNEEENFQAPVTKKKDTETKSEVVVSPEKAEQTVPIAAVSAEVAEVLLQEFVSGDRQGEELKTWVEEKRPVLPTVEKLIYHFLTEHEKLNPDPDCGWAEPSKYGAALATLVEDDLFNQMQVLWGIQQYCDTLGFPKLNGESVVQSMFRAMYKYDMVLDDAFAEWKEDESDAHEKGKMTAIIQTVEWFTWLEQEEEEEEEDEE